MSPNGGYDPVPIEDHDAMIFEERQRIAARSAIGAVKVAADLLGITFAEMVEVMAKERAVDNVLVKLADRRGVE